MKEFLGMKEDLALSLIFEFVGEYRYNRATEEYEAIAANLPPIKVLHGYVNDRLQEYAKAPPYRLCYFRAGDRRAWFEDFPPSLSIETVRTALVTSGMREKRSRKSSTR
jgi:hypothetical protein